MGRSRCGFNNQLQTSRCLVKHRVLTGDLMCLPAFLKAERNSFLLAGPYSAGRVGGPWPLLLLGGGQRETETEGVQDSVTCLWAGALRKGRGRVGRALI